MSLFGTLFTLLIGPTVPVPAPTSLLETLERVEVQHSDQGRSGFQMIFRVGRDQSDVLDYRQLVLPLLRPLNRLVMTVTFNGFPQILFHGVIMNQQLSPSEKPGDSRLTITGEDLSAIMDMEEKSVEHPAQPEAVIANRIIGTHGLIPVAIPPPSIDTPLPTVRTPVQQGTDLQYLRQMAERYGYVFYVEPGPGPLANKGYWGPPVRVGVPQRAISANMGADSNIIDINFEYDGLRPHFVNGTVQDRDLCIDLPVKTFASTRVPLVSQPAWLTQTHVRTKAVRYSGLNWAQAFARAQAETDRSQDSVVKATGQLDALRYESILKPRGLVGVRGVGNSYGGIYYVQQVKHTLEIGSYRQQFSLEREGLGAISPVVIP